MLLIYTNPFHVVLIEAEAESQQMAAREMVLDHHKLALHVHTFDHDQLQARKKTNKQHQFKKCLFSGGEIEIIKKKKYLTPFIYSLLTCHFATLEVYTFDNQTN